MTDRQIRCFLALYETLNFSAAARQLFLTQPTLSYQIRTLEEELGTPLFTRTTCRVEPTEAGQLFAAFAQNVRQSYQAFQHALAAGPARREKLVLQVPLTMASRDLVYHDLLMALSQELPDCDLEVRTDTSCTSPEEVLQSGVDALIQMLLEPVSDAIDCLPLFDTKCHLLASPGSPLSACGTLTPDQLAGQTICFESCDAVFVSMLRRCMEDIPLRWLMVPDFEKEYVRMLAGKCLFLSPVRSHGYPPEWFHPLIFPFPPAHHIYAVPGLHRLVQGPRQDHRPAGKGRLERGRRLAGRPDVPRPLRHPHESGPAALPRAGSLCPAGQIHIQRRVGVNLIFPVKTAKSRPGWGGSFCLPETKNQNHTALCNAVPA